MLLVYLLIGGIPALLLGIWVVWKSIRVALKDLVAEELKPNGKRVSLTDFVWSQKVNIMLLLFFASCIVIDLLVIVGTLSAL